MISVNSSLPDSPETIKKDPHNTWMIRLRLDDPGETSGLLDGTQYADFAK